MPDLLIELFSEEIPARMQARAGEDLKKRMTDGLVEAGLTYASAAAFTTPRRLVLTVEGVLDHSPAIREERKGPRVDAPEKAIEGFLRGAGVARADLEERDEKKGRVFYAVIERPGRPAQDIIAEVLEHTIRNFPWPKSMRWGTGSLRWVRPLQSILCILSAEDGADVVPLEVDGIVAGNTTRGHRFMASDPFSVTNFDDYSAKLKRAHVVLDATERAEHIWADATNQAFANGLEVVEDAALLGEVAGLVEWPVVLMGTIDPAFKDLPPEVLQSSMREHQKFFSVRNPKTGRIERFVTVANIQTPDHGATILAGNQKVLFARLSDAKFFWENDLRIAKSDMNVWTQALENVTFHNKLGTQAERVQRIAALARDIAPFVGADANEAEQAAQLAKADLSSEMVGEFPELQGLMGRYYASAAGHSDAIAAACEDHYAPQGPSDAVPTAPVSVAVALADKLDTLAGFWAIDEKPTGSKDPFALRRAALGVIRLVLENNSRLRLDRFIDAELLKFEIRRANGTPPALDLHTMEEALAEIAEHGVFGAALRTVKTRFDESAEKPDFNEGSWIDGIAKRLPDVSEHLLSFLHDRLKVYLRDQGIRHDIIDACIAMPENDDLTLLVKRATALNDTVKTEDGENLIQGFKRANNILLQAEENDGVEYSYGPDVIFAESGAETDLFVALDAAEAKITPAMAAEDFTAAMQAMAALRGPIDAFFTDVQVNVDNQTVRRNRLNLLHRIRTVCSSVADLTRIEG
jgi:glycyl-tRNA synthetase beta chain